VSSVDTAPLEGGIAALERDEDRARSAFALDPRELGEVDWLFCDVACYPRRLLDLLRRWLEAARCQRFVCTIKLQGRTDFEVLREFADLPDAQLRHLWHNKHELTFTSGVGPLR
jgi:23S rRNA (cytidine2498-2'-O)-methyltransferase